MQPVVLTAAKGTRSRPSTNDKPKVLVEVDDKPLIKDVFDTILEIGATELIVVGYQKEQLELTHAILQAGPHVDDDFVLILGDNIFRGNLGDTINRQQEDHADAVFLVDEVPSDVPVFDRDTGIQPRRSIGETRVPLPHRISDDIGATREGVMGDCKRVSLETRVETALFGLLRIETGHLKARTLPTLLYLLLLR